MSNKFDITDFGAIKMGEDGKMPPYAGDALEAAVEAAKRAGGGVVSIPEGVFNLIDSNEGA